jgi:hypothetical protein
MFKSVATDSPMTAASHHLQHGPVEHRDDVIALHGGNLAGTLTGQQDELQRPVELRPQQPDLLVGQDALAIRSRITLDQLARIDGEDLLTDRPREDRRRRGERLIGDDGRLDADHHHRPDVGAGDRAGLEIAPARQEMTAHQRLGLTPRLFVLPGV